MTSPPTRAGQLARAALIAAATLLAAPVHLARADAPEQGRPSEQFPVKVLVVNAFGFEAAPWLEALKPTLELPVPGLGKDGPAVHCTLQGVCQVTTGMGHANAAASMMALAYSGLFDLRHAYILIAGIAGIDPGHGTIGTVAWARYAVDIGIAHELDAREAPRSWQDGFFGIMTDGPGRRPAFDYRTEAFTLDGALLDAAFRLSRGAVLEDRADVVAYRRHYRRAPADQPPTIVECDTVSGDTWWGGARLGARAERWTRLLTDGHGRYCTTQQEDNATLNALTRADASGLVDLRRVAILRSGSDFDRPFPGQSAYRSMLDQRRLDGAGVIATRNLVHAGMPVIDAIVAHWDAWRAGPPTE